MKKTTDMLRNLWIQISDFFRGKSLLSRLVMVNIAVWLAVWLADFLVQWFTLKESAGSGFVSEWLLLPAGFENILARPWTVVTYMFFSGGFLQLLANVLLLTFSGMMFSRYLSRRKFVSVYFAGGILAGLSAVMCCWLSGDCAGLAFSGATAVAVCIFMAITAYIPGMPLFGKIKMKHIALIFVSMDLISLLSPEAQIRGGHVLNLCAAFWGFVMVHVPRVFEKRKSKIRVRRPEKRKPDHRRPETDEEYNRRRAENEKRIDEILDKISQSGYEKLTAEEKEFLFKTSSKR